MQYPDAMLMHACTCTKLLLDDDEALKKPVLRVEPSHFPIFPFIETTNRVETMSLVEQSIDIIYINIYAYIF